MGGVNTIYSARSRVAGDFNLDGILDLAAGPGSPRGEGRAVYMGDTANLGSASSVVNQIVSPATFASLTHKGNRSCWRQAGATVLETAQLSGGVARLKVSTLPAGPSQITVIYSGDSNIAGGAASLTQIVQN